MRALVIDSFAGGGGASLGIEQGIGRPVDIAINHDREAVAMHTANHPHTLHLCQDIWQVDPRATTKGRDVGLMWASPDCRHFSKAKGGKPVSKQVRDLAGVVVEWAAGRTPRGAGGELQGAREATAPGRRREHGSHGRVELGVGAGAAMSYRNPILLRIIWDAATTTPEQVCLRAARVVLAAMEAEK